jgi:hypothetical protein
MAASLSSSTDPDPEATTSIVELPQRGHTPPSRCSRVCCSASAAAPSSAMADLLLSRRSSCAVAVAAAVAAAVAPAAAVPAPAALAAAPSRLLGEEGALAQALKFYGVREVRVQRLLGFLRALLERLINALIQEALELFGQLANRAVVAYFNRQFRHRLSLRRPAL